MRLAYVRSIAWMMRLVRVTVGVLLTASVILNFCNIIGRYIFHAPIVGASEIMLFFMIAIVFLGCGAVAWEGRHIKMDILLDRFPKRLQYALRIVIEIVALIVSLVVIDLAIPVIQHLAMFDERSQAANVPLAIPQAFVAIGFALVILGTIGRLLDPLQRLGPSELEMLEDI